MLQQLEARRLLFEVNCQDPFTFNPSRNVSFLVSQSEPGSLGEIIRDEKCIATSKHNLTRQSVSSFYPLRVLSDSVLKSRTLFSACKNGTYRSIV